MMYTIKLRHFFSKYVIAVAFMGLLLAVITFLLTHDLDQQNHKSEFEYAMQEQVAAIQKELDLNLEVIRSLKHYFDSSKTVDRDEFKTFVGESLKEHKSIQALQWVPKVTHENRAEYENKASLELKQTYTFNQLQGNEMVLASNKAFYYPVYYIESLQENEFALGFDLSSDKKRYEPLMLSLSGNKMVTSSRIQLIEENNPGFGFLIFNPVWTKDERKDLKGFVVGIYRIEDIIEHALKYNTQDGNMLKIWLADVTQSRTQPEVLFTNSKDNEDFTAYESQLIHIQGRIWRLFAHPKEQFYLNHFHQFPLLTTLIVLLITLFIMVILAWRLNKEEELQKIVKTQTTTVDIANKKHESLLQMYDKKVIASKTDLSGKITYVSQAFCDISGFSKEELLGKNHNVVRHPDMQNALYEKLWTTINSGRTFYGEIKNKRKDGTYYWVDIQIEPEYDDEYNMIGYSAVREDITAKKQIEEFNQTLANKIEEAVIENTKKDKLLLEQSKMAAMGEMIGAIAHQWRQPLNTLAIKIQFLEDDYEDKLINKEYLKAYSKEAMKLIDFMSKTIDDFRNFFTIDKEKELFHVQEKIEQTMDILLVQLKSHAIALNIQGEDFEYLGYASEFQQVILNIVNNAKDALIENTVNDAYITIHMNKKEQIITIEDNAGGICQEVINRVFEPYFTTKEQGKGTGLGLYVSKMIIEDNMHGQLRVVNTAKGAQFVINLGEMS